MLRQERTSQSTTLSVVNYGLYQSLKPQEEQRKNIVGTSQEQRRNTNKNDKNDKNEKNNKIFVPPTLENVRGYCQERGNSVDPQRFIDFYESKGWMVGKNKMKDWKAAVRTWERGDRKHAGKPEREIRTDENGLVQQALRAGLDDIPFEGF